LDLTSLRFADLLRLPTDSSGRPQRAALEAAGLPIPSEVLEQVLHDHGANREFQTQYGHLDLRRITWALQPFAAGDLVTASVHPRFQPWVESVARRAHHVVADDWQELDARPSVVEHWRSLRTWQRSPVFLDAALVGSGTGIHLVEGHTRLGALIGLVHVGLIDVGSLHAVWLGRSIAVAGRGSGTRRTLSVS
jgi:hypothetical protein